MPRESTYHAIVLKLQPFGEADEIITFYTLEAGKVRGLAKSVKLAASKLRTSLQQMFSVEVTLAGSTKLPKIIRSTIAETYQTILADQERLARWFVAAELIMRATPDEQKNEDLFLLFQDFLRFLNRDNASLSGLEAGMAKFKIRLLADIGLGIWHPAETDIEPGAGPTIEPGAGPRFFSNSRGGFLNSRLSNDTVPIAPETWKAFQDLSNSNFIALADFAADVKQLQDILSSFIEYQLEREIKSERFIHLA